jgi:hypothetical protein
MWKLIGVMSVVLAIAALAAASSAPGKGGGTEVIKKGSCSGSATWKLKAKIDNGLIETEFEVDQNKVGKKWHVVIRQNGIKRFDGFRRTKAPSGQQGGQRPNRRQGASSRDRPGLPRRAHDLEPDQVPPFSYGGLRD